jgi:hypothetical protein
MDIWYEFSKYRDCAMRFEVWVNGLFTADVQHIWVAKKDKDTSGHVYIIDAANLSVLATGDFNLGIGKRLLCVPN